MKKYLCFILLFCVFLCGADTLSDRPAHWAQPVSGTTLKNLYRVGDGVYRAEQPEAKDIPDLKKLKIRTLLSLREFHQDADVFRQSGFRLVRYKMNPRTVTAGDLAAALQSLDKAEKPVLVHCWHGSDRTGLVVAGYRLIFQNWTREAVIEEFRLGGFGYHSQVYPHLKRILQDLDIEAVKASVVSR